jgi:hypothetical protein
MAEKRVHSRSSHTDLKSPVWIVLKVENWWIQSLNRQVIPSIRPVEGWLTRILR